MGVSLISNIEPKNNGDFYLVEDNYIKGGYRIVDTVADRDLITTERRKNGMKVAVKSGASAYKEYILVLGTVDNDLSNNGNWVDYITLLNIPAPVASGSSIKYFWASLTEQNATTPTEGETGVRSDLLGRPVLIYKTGAWINVKDPVTNKNYYLDGPANTVQYTNSGNPSITSVQDALDTLLYVPLSVNFGGGGTYEIGTTINSVNFSWSTSGGNGILTQTLTRTSPTNGAIATISPGTNAYNLTGVTINTNTSYNLSINDSKGYVNRGTSVSFVPKIYWGSFATDPTITPSNVLGLSQTLASGRGGNFTTNVLNGEYFWYCLPTNFGTPTFTVGGFAGGFRLIHSALSFTNAQGYTQTYDIWRSDNPSLASVTANIS